MAALLAPVEKAEECLKLLVKAGADVNALESGWNYSPFDLVMWNRGRQIVAKAIQRLGGHRVNADPF